MTMTYAVINAQYLIRTAFRTAVTINCTYNVFTRKCYVLLSSANFESEKAGHMFKSRNYRKGTEMTQFLVLEINIFIMKFHVCLPQRSNQTCWTKIFFPKTSSNSSKITKLGSLKWFDLAKMSKFSENSTRQFWN